MIPGIVFYWGKSMEKATEKILLAAGKPDNARLFEDMIGKWKDIPIETFHSEREAWKALQENLYCIVVIISPLPDSFGFDLARQAATTSAGVLLVCRPERYETAVTRLTENGVCVFSTDMGRRLLSQTLQLLYAVHVRLSQQEPQTQILQDKLKDIRLVSRAKCLLIQYENMTEEEAHRSIEQEAMNSRRSRREVAQGILDRYL